MNKLIYDIADEYLPDVTILGIDGPNTGLAGDIVDKVLDAAVSAADEEMSFLDDSISKGDKSLVLEAINKLRGEKE